mmetsp:Transcript_16358/g.22936  ORF Transcript_16358/g.22936 Transcript_16358/m.22936 type:complete len:297 (-) Transcript_16358:79-969(-)
MHMLACVRTTHKMHRALTCLEFPSVFAVIFSRLTGPSFLHAEDEIAVSVAVQHFDRFEGILLVGIADVCEPSGTPRVLISGKKYASRVAASAEKLAQVVLRCLLGYIGYLETVLLLLLEAHASPSAAQMNRYISPRPPGGASAAARRAAVVFARLRVGSDERALWAPKREVPLLPAERADDDRLLLRCAQLVFELRFILVFLRVMICRAALHLQSKGLPIDSEKGLLRVVAEGRAELLPFLALLDALADSLLLRCDLHFGDDLLDDLPGFVALIRNNRFDPFVVDIRLVHVFSNGA